MSLGAARRLAGAVVVPLLLLLLLATATPAAAGTRPRGGPLVLDPDLSLSEQYDYAPDYTRSIPTFDAEGRPYLRSRSADPDYTGYVNTWRDGRWVRRDFVGAVRAAYPTFTGFSGGAGCPTNRVVFDTADRAYTLVTIKLQDGTSHNLLLWSTDYCSTWQVTELPRGEIASEFWVGHNTIDGPPLLLISATLEQTDPDTNKRVRTLAVAQPYFSGDGIAVPDPTVVSVHCLGLSTGSGDATMAVSSGTGADIVYTETTATPAKGSPVYVVRFDKLTGTMGARVRVAFSKPANDGHAKSGICLDAEGYIHVVVGGHGTPFQWTRSKSPGTPYAGWTTPLPVCSTGWRATPTSVSQRGRQTYLALVCDAHDILHIAFRQWRRGTDHRFNGAWYGALATQRMEADGIWSDPKVVVVPPYSGYQLFFQQLGLDHRGQVFLSAACISGPEVKERKIALARRRQSGAGGQPPLYLRRMLFVSADAGYSWRLAGDDDLAPAVP